MKKIVWQSPNWSWDWYWHWSTLTSDGRRCYDNMGLIGMSWIAVMLHWLQGPTHNLVSGVTPMPDRNMIRRMV